MDNITLLAAMDTFTGAHDTLVRMMVRLGGVEEWSREHNSLWEIISKFVLKDFTRQKEVDINNTSWRIGMMQPGLVINGTHIKPMEIHRYMGLIFNQELRRRQQAEVAVAKGTKWILQFKCIAHQSTRTSLRLMRRLCSAVAIAKMT